MPKDSQQSYGLLQGSSAKGICTRLELSAFVDGSGIHVPLAPHFLSVLGEK